MMILISLISADDIIAFYDSRRISDHMNDVPTTILITISGIAIMAAFGIGINYNLRFQRNFSNH